MLVRAGEHAASLAAPTEAERHFVQAAELTDDDPEKARLFERAGQMAYQGGGLDGATAHYEHAMSLFQSLGYAHPAARVSARLADIDWEQGRLIEPLDRMEQAFAVLSQQEPDEDLATLAAQLGRLHFFKGEMDDSRKRLEAALEIAEPLGLPEAVSQALNTKALVLLFEGRTEEAFALLKHALELALENDLSTAALRAYVNLSELLQRRDRLADSLESYEQGLTLARRAGNRVWEVALLSEMTFPLFVTGRWDEAIKKTSEIPGAEMARADILGPLLSLPAIHVSREEIESAKQVLTAFARYEDSEDIQERAAYAVGQAVIHGAQGRWSPALRSAEEAAAMGRRIGPDNHMLKMGLDQGIEAAFALADLVKVEDLLGQIEGLRPAEITPMLRAILGRGRARLTTSRGVSDGVERGFKGSAAVFREIGAPYWLAATLVELGEWLTAQERISEAEPLLSEAVGIFESLRAQQWLDRLEQARSTSPTPATEASAL